MKQPQKKECAFLEADRQREKNNYTYDNDKSTSSD